MASSLQWRCDGNGHWSIDSNSSQPVAAVRQGDTSHVRQGDTSQSVAAASHDDHLLELYADLCEWITDQSKVSEIRGKLSLRSEIRGKLSWRSELGSHFQRKKKHGGPICTEHTQDVLKQVMGSDGSILKP